MQLSQHLKPVDRKFCDKSFAESEISTPVFTGGKWRNVLEWLVDLPPPCKVPGPPSRNSRLFTQLGRLRLTMGLIHQVFSVQISFLYPKHTHVKNGCFRMTPYILHEKCFTKPSRSIKSILKCCPHIWHYKAIGKASFLKGMLWDIIKTKVLLLALVSSKKVWCFLVDDSLDLGGRLLVGWFFFHGGSGELCHGWMVDAAIFHQNLNVTKSQGTPFRKIELLDTQGFFAVGPFSESCWRCLGLFYMLFFSSDFLRSTWEPGFEKSSSWFARI